MYALSRITLVPRLSAVDDYTICVDSNVLDTIFN